MKISFIVPYYKTREYFKELLDSLTTLSTHSRFEVVVVDDASNDNVQEIINMHSALNVKLVTLEKNVGLGFARNIGLENISDDTTHIVYIDSDDKISNLFKFQNEYKEDVVYIYSMNRFNKKTVKYFRHDYRKWFGKDGEVKTNSYIWGLVIPVNIAKRYQFKRRTYEDLEVKSEMISKEKVVCFDEPMIDYRLRKKSLTTTANGSIDRFEAYEYIINNNLTAKTLFFKTRMYETYFLMSRKNRRIVKSRLPEFNFLRVKLACIAILFQKISFFKYWYNGFNLYD